MLLLPLTRPSCLQDAHPPLPETISPLLEDFLLKCFQKVGQKQQVQGQTGRVGLLVHASTWLVFKHTAQLQHVPRSP